MKQYYDSIQPTQSINIKRPRVEEWQIITTVLQKYPKHERQFNAYKLGYLDRPPGSYYLTIVWEVFVNYPVILDKDCPKVSKVVDMQNEMRFSVGEVTIDISEHTINQLLVGQLYIIITNTLEIEH